MIKLNEERFVLSDGEKIMWFRIQTVDQLKTRPPSKYDFFHITSNPKMCEEFSPELSKRGRLQILCMTLGLDINFVKYDEDMLKNFLKYPIVISKLLACSTDVLVFFSYFTDDIEDRIFCRGRSEWVDALKAFCENYSGSFEREPDFSGCSNDDYEDAVVWLEGYRKRFASDKRLRSGFSLVIEDIEKADPSVNMVINVDDPYMSEAIIWRQSVLD